MSVARVSTNFCEPVSRLRKHSLVEPITDNTYVIKDGWATGLIFVLDPRSNKCVIVDPSVTKKIEREFRAGYVRRIWEAIEEVLRTTDINAISGIINERLSTTEARRQLLRDLDGYITEHDIIRDPHDGIFIERVAQIAELIASTGLEVEAILATHHHIDHFGCARILRDTLGIRERVMMPDPTIFKRLSTSRRGDLWVVDQEANSQTLVGIERFRIKTVDISGHTLMTGLLFPDGILLVGDLVATENLWARGVPYIEDVSRHLGSLMRVSGTGFEKMVLSHGTAYIISHEPSMDLLRLNLERVNAIRGFAWQNAYSIDAADAYLQSIRQNLSPEYLGLALVIAMSIGNYK